jgi:1-acyl-sn-glycerol-3-phosphate acyltransferase
MPNLIPWQTWTDFRARSVSRLRQCTSLIYGGYAWLLFFILVPPVSLLIMLLPRVPQRRHLARSAARLLFRLAGMSLQMRKERRSETDSIGGGPLLPETPHVLVVNHCSFIDGIALTALLPAEPGYAFVVRREFSRQSIFCPLLQALGVIVMEHHPGSRPHANVQRIVTALRCKQNVLLFPEGGFQPSPGLQIFHTGAFAAAAEAGVPIVCAGLRGARSALPPRSWRPHRSAITLNIGPVLTPSGIDEKNIHAMRDTAQGHILRLANERDLYGKKPQ